MENNEINTYIDVQWAKDGIPSVDDIIDAAASGMVSRSKKRYHELVKDMSLTEAMGFLKRIIGWGHDSVLETIVFKFWLSCSRIVSHEHVRHRIASNTQKSTRYQDSDDLEMDSYVVPPMIPFEYLDDWVHDNIINLQTYQKWLKRGIPQDVARRKLNGELRTDIRFTINARALRNYFKLRLSNKVDFEIRDMALMMYELIKDVNYQFLFDDVISSEFKKV